MTSKSLCHDSLTQEVGCRQLLRRGMTKSMEGPIPDDALSTLEKSHSQEVETNGPSSHHL